MAKEPPRHPQVTEDQVEIWLANPVTKTLLQCFQWKFEDTRDAAGTGKLVDSGNADLTHAMLHRALGQQDIWQEAQQVEAVLEHYEMVFHPPPEDEEEDDG